MHEFGYANSYCIIVFESWAIARSVSPSFLEAGLLRYEEVASVEGDIVSIVFLEKLAIEFSSVVNLIKSLCIRCSLVQCYGGRGIESIRVGAVMRFCSRTLFY